MTRRITTTQIEEAFAGALDTPEEEREALLSARVRDPAARSEVRRLLARHTWLEISGDAFLRSLDPQMAGALLDAAAIVPETIGRYRVERRLARGGYGVVYLARDPDLDRPVAIKILPPDRVGSAAARERLKAEARAVSALDHPHIATVHEIGETALGELYIVMGFYVGETLRARLARGQLPLDQAQRIGAELADALAAAHANGSVHRDVKPENVILTERGVRLVDFGVATTTDAASRRSGAAGTVAYMSPEQSLGAPADPQVDVWALGVVLYEMLAGKRPFAGDRPDALLEAIRGAEPAPLRRLRPEVPERLACAVHACLAKAPIDRPPGAGAVRHLLNAPQRRRRTTGVAAVLLLAAGAVAGAQWVRGQAEAAPPRGIAADAVAEGLYVQAMGLLGAGSPRDLEQASILLRTAIARDSTFARAYAGLARVMSQARIERPADQYARTRPLLERAVALDPTSPDVLDELGWVALWYDRDLLRAEELFRQALALDPTDPWKYHYYAAWLSLIGRIDEAVELERRAMAVDPRGGATATHVALHLTLQEKHEEAIVLLERVLTTDTTWARTHAVLGRAYLAAGRYEDALRHLRRDNYQFAGFDSDAMLAYGLGVAGRREEALRITAGFERKARDSYTNPINLVACYLGLGDTARALEWAERIPDDRGVLWFPRSDPMFEPLFAEPRFQRVLERLGLDSASVAQMPETWSEIETMLRPQAAGPRTR